MLRHEASKIELLCVLLTVVALIPVWLYSWFPTQDGPSHLYNAMLLADWGDPGATTTHAVFQRVLTIFPNWNAYVLLAVLGRVFTPWVAIKIVISLCVASISAATLYLQKSFKPAADPTALLGVMLGFTYLLFMGFFNFILGCALFGWTVGFRWRRRSTTTIFALYGLLTLCYLTHGFAFSATVMSLALLDVVLRRWSDMIVLSPAGGLAVIDAWPRLHGERGYQDLAWHLKRLFSLDPFAYFRAVHGNIASIMSGLMIVAIVITLSRTRRWPPIVLSATLLFLFLASPWSLTLARSHASWLSNRFLMLFVMTLPAWLELPRPRVVLAVIVTLTVAHLGTTWRDVAVLSDEIDAVARCRTAIDDHSTLGVVGQPPQLVTKLDPALHAPAYLAVGRDVAYLANYEAESDDFPIRYRHQERPQPQFVFAWRGAKVSGSVVCQGSGFRILRSPSASLMRP
jgi:hypothetical protein